MNKYATVEDIAEVMLDLMAQGKADYIVTCNGEYFFAKKGDVPDICEENKTADLGGYM